jgi:hypothetical protein
VCFFRNVWALGFASCSVWQGERISKAWRHQRSSRTSQTWRLIPSLGGVCASALFSVFCSGAFALTLFRVCGSACHSMRRGGRIFRAWRHQRSSRTSPTWRLIPSLGGACASFMMFRVEGSACHSVRRGGRIFSAPLAEQPYLSNMAVDPKFRRCVCACFVA